MQNEAIGQCIPYFLFKIRIQRSNIYKAWHLQNNFEPKNSCVLFVRKLWWCRRMTSSDMQNGAVGVRKPLFFIWYSDSALKITQGIKFSGHLMSQSSWVVFVWWLAPQLMVSRKSRKMEQLVWGTPYFLFDIRIQHWKILKAWNFQGTLYTKVHE